MDATSSLDSSPVARPRRRHFWRSFKKRFSRSRGEGDPESSGSDVSPSTPDSLSGSRQDASLNSGSAPRAVPPPLRSPNAVSSSGDATPTDREEGAEVRGRLVRFSRWRSLKAAGKVTHASSSSLGSSPEDSGAIPRASQASSSTQRKEGHSSSEDEGPQTPSSVFPVLTKTVARPESFGEPASSRPPATASLTNNRSVGLPLTSFSPSQQPGIVRPSPLWLLEEAPAGILSYPHSRPPTEQRPVLGKWEDVPASPAESSLSEEEVRRGGLLRSSTPSQYGSSPSSYSSRDSSPGARSVDKGGIGPLFRGRKSQRQSERMSASWNGWEREGLHYCEHDGSPERLTEEEGGETSSSGDSRLAQMGLRAHYRTVQRTGHESGSGAFAPLTKDSRTQHLDSMTPNWTAPLATRHGPIVQATTRQVPDSALGFPASSPVAPTSGVRRRPPSPSPPPLRSTAGGARAGCPAGGSRSRTANVYRSALLGGGRGPSPSSAASRSSRAVAFTSSAAARATREGASEAGVAPRTDRGSMSRIVALAEALFEVLDELQVQNSPAVNWVPSSSGRARQPAPRAAVQALPLHVFEPLEQSPATTADGETDTDALPQCYICLTEYLSGDRLRRLPCGHEYHSACIDKWLLQVHRVCPVCRRDVCISGETTEGQSSRWSGRQ